MSENKINVGDLVSFREHPENNNNNIKIGLVLRIYESYEYDSGAMRTPTIPTLRAQLLVDNDTRWERNLLQLTKVV